MPKDKLKAQTLEELLRKSPPKKPKEKVSNRIAEILAERKMTQSELIDLTGMYKGHLSDIIQGTRTGVTVPVAMKIAQALKLKIEDIFFIPNV